MSVLSTSCSSIDWVTDDLLVKIEGDPVLSKAFKDPAMSEALAQFQANPQQALAATKDKPEVSRTLVLCLHSSLKVYYNRYKSFCNHFVL